MNNVKKLGEYLARILDEDEFKSAEDLLIKIDKEINLLEQIVSMAENYIGDDSNEKDSIDFWNTLYEFRGNWE